MTYADDSVITPRLTTLPSGPFTDIPTELALYPGVLHGGLIPGSAASKRVLAAPRRGLGV
ncbi:hypothetical protein [Streptomyces sp. NPDC101776]|uniref:hypothetical protein n=1 Tax=Streptomyces sp. NPDC101776 TaxID=3366146 RepID=UPI0037FF2363